MMKRLTLAIAAGVAAALAAFTFGRGLTASPASATRPTGIAISTARSATDHEEGSVNRIESRSSITEVGSSDLSGDPHPEADDASEDDSVHSTSHESNRSYDVDHHEDNDAQHDGEHDEDSHNEDESRDD